MALKPVIGISACLLGQRVRYDGGDRFSQLIDRWIAPHAELRPFCPELEAGLGVPRPPIQLVLTTANGVRVQGVDDSTHDPTEALLNASCTFAQNHPALDAYIFKSRSPSCGLSKVPLLVGEKNSKEGIGLFAGTLLHAYPHLVVIEESDLESEQACHDFLRVVLRQVDGEAVK